MNDKEYVKDKDLQEDKGARRRKPKSRKRVKDGKARGVDTNSRTNDVAWYVSDPVLLHNAANISFNNPLGNTLDWTELTKLGNNITATNFNALDNAIPGVMRINYIPSIGYSVDKTSQVNIATRDMFAAIRNTLSSTQTKYDASEQMKYILSVDSLYALHAYLIRIYGLMTLYKYQNRYWPKSVIESMGIDFEDLMVHMSDFRYFINTLAVRINSLAVPAEINLFKRHYMLNSTIWKDGEVEKSQLYYFAPVYLYRYEAVNQPDVPSYLDPYEMPKCTDKFTLKDLADVAENMVISLLTNEDIGIIAGDLIKAFGSEGLAKLPLIESNFTIEPQFDMMVLHQIHNTNFVGYRAEASELKEQFRITEMTTITDYNAGALHQAPVISYPAPSGTATFIASAPLTLGNIFDVHGLDDVPAEIVMEISRNAMCGVMYAVADDQAAYFALQGFGTEIFTTYNIFTLRSNGTLEHLIGDSTYNIPRDTAMKQFNLSPLTINVSALHMGGTDTINLDFNGGMNLEYVPAVNGNLENYTTIANATLRRLHDVALWGLFNIPTYGEYMSRRLK